jgi:Mrp family chromosome partitioning ATPase
MNAILASKFQLLRVRIESDVKLASVIMVTSAHANDGKTLTAYGLAECLTKVGHRTALVDTCSASNGVAKRWSSDALERNFPILSLSSQESGPTASRDAVYAFVEQMRSRYDYTIVDAAPLMSNSVAMLLAGSVDAVLLAVRHGRAPSEDDELMVQTLRHLRAKVLGVIASAPESIAEFERLRGANGRSTSRFVTVEPRVDDVASSALFAR